MKIGHVNVLSNELIRNFNVGVLYTSMYFELYKNYKQKYSKLKGGSGDNTTTTISGPIQIDYYIDSIKGKHVILMSDSHGDIGQVHADYSHETFARGIIDISNNVQGGIDFIYEEDCKYEHLNVYGDVENEPLYHFRKMCSEIKHQPDLAPNLNIICGDIRLGKLQDTIQYLVNDTIKNVDSFVYGLLYEKNLVNDPSSKRVYLSLMTPCHKYLTEIMNTLEGGYLNPPFSNSYFVDELTTMSEPIKSKLITFLSEEFKKLFTKIEDEENISKVHNYYFTMIAMVSDIYVVSKLFRENASNNTIMYFGFNHINSIRKILNYLNFFEYASEHNSTRYFEAPEFKSFFQRDIKNVPRAEGF